MKTNFHTFNQISNKDLLDKKLNYQPQLAWENNTVKMKFSHHFVVPPTISEALQGNLNKLWTQIFSHSRDHFKILTL